MNKTTKTNLKRTLAVFLTLLMLMTSWVFVAPSAAAESLSGNLIGQFFATDSKWEDTQGGGLGLGWVTGGFPSDKLADGFYYINSNLKIDHTSIFQNVTAETGMTVAYTYRPNQGGNYRHLFSFGLNDASTINQHFYISSNPSHIGGSSAIPVIGYVDNGGGQHINAYPNGGPAFEVGKTYDVVIRITSTAITYWINGIEYTAACDGDSPTYLAQFLNEVKNYQNNFIGRSRWNDADFDGYVKNMRIYGAAMTAQEVAIDDAYDTYTRTYGSADLTADLTQSGTKNQFNAVAYHCQDPATGTKNWENRGDVPDYDELVYGVYGNAYRNLAYAPFDQTEWIEKEWHNCYTTLATPNNVVMVYDGVAGHEPMSPIMMQLKGNGSNGPRALDYLAVDEDVPSLSFRRQWAGYMDESNDGYKQWPDEGTGRNGVAFNKNSYINYQVRARDDLHRLQTENQDNKNTRRDYGNAFVYVGSGNSSIYYELFSATKLHYSHTWYGTSKQVDDEKIPSKGNIYVLTYKPVYDALPAALSCYAELAAHEGWYTEASVARARATIAQLVLANPKNAAYTYGTDVNPAVQNCAINIQKAVALLGSTDGGTYTYEGLHLVKRTGTVIWENEDGTELDRTTVEYGTAPTYNGVATPEKSEDQEYSYTFSGWTDGTDTFGTAPTWPIVEAPSVTYTATYSSTPRTYNVSATGTHISNTTDTTATFGTDYSATEPYTTPVPQTDSNLYKVNGVSGVTIGGNAYTGGTVNADYSVEIPGAAINGDIVVTYTTDGNLFPVTVVDSNNHMAVTALADAQYNTSYSAKYSATLTPADHYHIVSVDSVSVNGHDLSASAYSYTSSSRKIEINSTNITGAVTINVTTAKDQVSVNFSSNLMNASKSVNYGEEISEPLSLAAGYYFTEGQVQVLVDENELTLGTDYTFANGVITIPAAKVTGNVQINAIANNTYLITWIDGDGNTLKSEPFAYGATPAYSGTTPSKTATAQYSYTFNNTWSPAITSVTGPATYTANFTETVNTYSVTWRDGDGNDLKSEPVAYGQTPAYSGTTPTKTADAQYTYTFNNTWSPAITAVTGPAIYTAQFGTTLNEYDIIFKNEDGTEVQSGKEFYGATPAYTGPTPTKAPTTENVFTFAGWKDSSDTQYPLGTNLPSVTGTATYTAYYTSGPRHYTITWIDGDGNSLGTDSFAYGATPAYTGDTPTKTATAQYTYTFNETWSPAITTVSGDATYTAQFNATVNEYEITWIDGDGNSLGTDSFAYGTTPAYSGAEPTKTATDEFTYSFNNTWSPEIVPVTQAATYTAQFTETTRTYTITWNYKDTNGSDTSTTTTVAYGHMPTPPEALSGTQYNNGATTYTLSGWTPALESVTGTATYTATYVEGDRTVNVTWKYYDAEGTLQTDTVPAAYGVAPTAPVSEGYQTESTVYTLTGWNDGTDTHTTLPAVTADTTFTAVYSEATREYTIKWLNGDNQEIKSESVAYGLTPAYTGATPTKTATAQYSYTFNNTWSPAIVAVAADATYTAQFDPSVNKYKVTFLDEDGETVIKVDAADENNYREYDYGTAAADIAKPADPTKEATAQYTYTFGGWTPALAEVTEDAAYTATYTPTLRSYTINFKNESGDLLQSGEVAYGEIPVYNGSTPTKTPNAQYTYSFAGWDSEPVAVTGAATYTATYTPTVRSYTVTWKNTDNTVLGTGTFIYGATPVYSGETPTKAADAQYTYTHSGWTAEGGSAYDLETALPAVEGDATYTAMYSGTLNKYTVTWQNYNETELEIDENVEYGTVPTYDGETPTKPASGAETFNFTGWDPEVSAVTGNITYTATFDSAATTYTVTWKNGEETIETDENVAYGATPEYNGTTPTKEAQGDTAYTFDGWNDGTQTYGPTDTLPAVHGNVTFTAVFAESARKYTVTFTDNLGGSESVPQEAGTYYSVAKPGYKLHDSSSATVGTISIATQIYTFGSGDGTVTLKYVLDVDALLGSAQEILNNAGSYQSSYITELAAAKDQLEQVCGDPDQLAAAAEYQNALQNLVNNASAYAVTATFTVTFHYGKNGDFSEVRAGLHGGDSVTAPAAEDTSYISAGFTYPVTYWTNNAEGEGTQYTTSFPPVLDNADYYAFYSLYDLADDLDKIQKAKARENVVGTDDINAIEAVLADIDTLFAQNGVVTNEYISVQENPIDKTTTEGSAFITTLADLISRLQSVSSAARVICAGHEFDYYDQKTPTCTEPGNTGYRVCRICGTTLGGEEIPATGHGTYNLDAARSGSLSDGTCSWETYTCSHGCGDYYLIPTYVVRYSDGATVPGAIVTLFVNGQNIEVFADNGGRANFRGRLAPHQLVEGEYDLTVTLGETAKTGTMLVHNGRVTINITRLDRPDQGGDGGNGGSDSGPFRCPMCNAYDELRTMPVVGWFVAIVHFFVHMAYRIIGASTSFSGKFIF